MPLSVIRPAPLARSPSSNTPRLRSGGGAGHCKFRCFVSLSFSAARNAGDRRLALTFPKTYVSEDCKSETGARPVFFFLSFFGVLQRVAERGHQADSPFVSGYLKLAGRGSRVVCSALQNNATGQIRVSTHAFRCVAKYSQKQALRCCPLPCRF